MALANNRRKSPRPSIHDTQHTRFSPPPWNAPEQLCWSGHLWEGTCPQCISGSLRGLGPGRSGSGASSWVLTHRWGQELLHGGSRWLVSGPGGGILACGAFPVEVLHSWDRPQGLSVPKRLMGEEAGERLVFQRVSQPHTSQYTQAPPEGKESKLACVSPRPEFGGKSFPTVLLKRAVSCQKRCLWKILPSCLCFSLSPRRDRPLQGGVQTKDVKGARRRRFSPAAGLHQRKGGT